MYVCVVCMYVCMYVCVMCKISVILITCPMEKKHQMEACSYKFGVMNDDNNGPVANKMKPCNHKSRPNAMYGANIYFNKQTNKQTTIKLVLREQQTELLIHMM
jgi:hypothetical protein